MRTSLRSFGLSVSSSLRSRRAFTVLAVSVMLAGGGMSQGNRSASVQQALDEVLAVIPGMTCEAPEVWTVDGDSELAAASLLDALRERGWGIMEHGSTDSGYAVIADPDPDDPTAYAIGGLLFREVEPNVTAAYITRCTHDPADAPIDPSYFT